MSKNINFQEGPLEDRVGNRGGGKRRVGAVGPAGRLRGPERQHPDRGQADGKSPHLQPGRRVHRGAAVQERRAGRAEDVLSVG